MRPYWVASLGLVALLGAEGCKHKDREPIPGPKAIGTEALHSRAAGIAWFQEGLDEAFARSKVHATCNAVRAPMAPLTPDLPRARVRAPTSSPAPAVPTIRRPLV